MEFIAREVLQVGVGSRGGVSRWPWPRGLPKGLWESLGWYFNLELWVALKESMSCWPSLLFGWVLVNVVVPGQGVRWMVRSQRAQDDMRSRCREGDRWTNGRENRQKPESQT